MSTARTAVVLLLLATAGCVVPGSQTQSVAAASRATAGDPVVIAILDSGGNPYLPGLELADETVIHQVVHAPFTTVPVSLEGAIVDRLERDAATWDSLERGELYHYEGTRALAISFHAKAGHPYTLDRNRHGGATLFLAGRDAPNAVIVSVQISFEACDPQPCLIDPTIAEGMEWIADQDWIDVVSISLGLPVNAPDPSAVHPEVERFLAASERAARSGKLIVNAASNEVLPTTPSYFTGTPWVIAVGGAEPEANGESIYASKAVDVIANFTEYAPREFVESMGWRSGTSFGTPVVAATLAAALDIIHQAEPERGVTTKELRDALNASAVLFTGPWSPVPAERNGLALDLYGSGSAPVLTQAQMGWGYVNASLAPEIARRVLENDYAVPAAKSEAALVQPAYQQAREEYWARMRD